MHITWAGKRQTILNRQIIQKESLTTLKIAESGHDSNKKWGRWRNIVSSKPIWRSSKAFGSSQRTNKIKWGITVHKPRALPETLQIIFSNEDVWSTLQWNREPNREILEDGRDKSKRFQIGKSRFSNKSTEQPEDSDYQRIRLFERLWQNPRNLFEVIAYCLLSYS